MMERIAPDCRLVTPPRPMCSILRGNCHLVNTPSGHSTPAGGAVAGRASIDSAVLSILALVTVTVGMLALLGMGSGKTGPNVRVRTILIVVRARSGPPGGASAATSNSRDSGKRQQLNSSPEIETQVLKGTALAKRLRAEIDTAKERLIAYGGTNPTLATLLVGGDPAARAYRSSIDRTFHKVKLDLVHRELPRATTSAELVATVGDLNRDPAVTGILVLMPLPDHLDPHLILERLSPLKDVDGITPTNAGRLHLGLPSLRPSTPAGGLGLLDFHRINLEGARVTVIGRSNVVGRPLATLLTQRHATVTLCHRRTVDLAAETRRAEIVCVAAGSPGLVTREMVAPGAVVLDFGVNVDSDGRVVGDADFDGLLGRAGAITPVPGGTGPVTALMLARNTLAAGFAGLRGTLDHVLLDLPDEIEIPADATDGVVSIA